MTPSPAAELNNKPCDVMSRGRSRVGGPTLREPERSRGPLGSVSDGDGVVSRSPLRAGPSMSPHRPRRPTPADEAGAEPSRPVPRHALSGGSGRRSQWAVSGLIAGAGLVMALSQLLGGMDEVGRAAPFRDRLPLGVHPGC